MTSVSRSTDALNSPLDKNKLNTKYFKEICLNSLLSWHESLHFSEVGTKINSKPWVHRSAQAGFCTEALASLLAEDGSGAELRGKA